LPLPQLSLLQFITTIAATMITTIMKGVTSKRELQSRSLSAECPKLLDTQAELVLIMSTSVASEREPRSRSLSPECPKLLDTQAELVPTTSTTASGPNVWDTVEKVDITEFVVMVITVINSKRSQSVTLASSLKRLEQGRSTSQSISI
jgi:hypothetical protein